MGPIEWRPSKINFSHNAFVSNWPGTSHAIEPLGQVVVSVSVLNHGFRCNNFCLLSADPYTLALERIARPLGRLSSTSRGNEPELGEQGAQPIELRDALGHQARTHPMHGEDGLLLHALHRHEAHGRPRHCFADRSGVGSINVVAFVLDSGTVPWLVELPFWHIGERPDHLLLPS